MVNAPGGSFIPKRSTGKVSPVRSGKRIYVFSYVTYVLFFGTLLSVAGIFFLNQQAERQLAAHISMLEEERASFDGTRISEIKALDRQLSLAEDLLNRHAAPSIIFDELEDIVLKTVQFTSFSYNREPGKGARLALTGKTASFDVLIFQREVINESDFLASADLVSVGYGSVSEEIGAADRQNPQTIERVDATVIFSFADDNILGRIGYRPRSLDRNVNSNRAVSSGGGNGLAEDTEETAATEGVDDPEIEGTEGASNESSVNE